MRQSPTRKTAAIALSAAALIVSLPAGVAHAAVTDISNVPLSSTSSATVKPNLLLTVDTSGSMGWDFMPDGAAPDQSSDFGETSSTAYNCLTQSGGNNACLAGDPPYYANQFNYVAYNPSFTYTPGVNSAGGLVTGITSPTADAKGNILTFNTVPTDAYLSPSTTIDLTSKFPEQAYANSGGAYKRNGEPWPYGNVAPTENGVIVPAFSYATPKGPAATGVTLSGYGGATPTITATFTYNNGTAMSFSQGDMIDVQCTTGTGATTPFQLAQSVPVLTSTTTVGSSTTTNTFTFYAGWNFGGSLACTKATISYSVVGLPEQSTESFTVHSSAMTASTTGSGSNRTVTVTVNFYNHMLVNGDVITVSGGTNCSASGATVINATYSITAPYVGTPYNFQYQYKSSTSVTSCTAGKFTVTRNAYNSQLSGTSSGFYYTMTPIEYCTDKHLYNCALAGPGGTAPSGYSVAAYVRYCNSAANATAAAPVSSSSAISPKCQNKYLFSSGYIYPRYGQFTRTDIVSGNTFTNWAGRTDCGTGTTCTYAQEATNFANWYTYYRTRLQMMKSLLGLSLLNLGNTYRVGFININPDVSQGKVITSSNKIPSTSYVAISDFTSAQKSSVYTTFYNLPAKNSTPLRSALARAGRYFAGKHDLINSGMTDDPVQYSCQQNFVLLTTDGYWNAIGSTGDTDSVKMDGSTVVGDQDSTAATQSQGIYEGPKGMDYSTSTPTVLSTCAAGQYSKGGCANTLADVAAYYYNTDLRPSGSTNLSGTDVSQDNVPVTPQDPANWQHMTTFTLGLADGLLTWQSNYETATSGDFYSITNGQTGCWWPPSNGGSSAVCQWPVPMHDTPQALDDLWHAAVNGHGSYYHGTNPKSVSSGIMSALSGINVRLAAAAASSTSSPNITQQNNVIYSSTYETVQWSGDLIAQNVNTSTGQVIPTVVWDAANTLDGAAGASSDSRVIYSYDLVAKAIKPFAWTSLTTAEQAVFTNVCGVMTNLTQCPSLTPAQLTQINDGYDLLNFIRGQRGNEGTLFHQRIHVLGDTVDAQPAFVATPIYGFTDAPTGSYAAFVAANASRQPVLYIGANDGMLHAFNASAVSGSTGNELWAYVPRMLWKKLYVLGDLNYGTMHQFYVDGSPVTMDAYFGGAWHTVLVGGLNSGGSGYYALDVTNPANPTVLWEFCSDSTLCNNYDTDMGLSYGNPIITKRASDGKWVALVTSGYNNLSGANPGKEFLYILDLATGLVLQKVPTNVGSSTSPGGLAKINAWADTFWQDNTSKYVYGGDLLGNVWRFDLTTNPATVMSLGVLTDTAGNLQPVTTRPELGLVQNFRVLYVGTGEYLGQSDLSNSKTQSLYAFKDLGTAYVPNVRSGNLVQQTISNVTTTTRTTTTYPVDWTSKNGWFVDFPTGGERMNVDPQLVLGTLVVFTNIPGTNACTVGGSSWDYEFDYDSGSFVSTSPNQIVGTMNQNAVTVGNVVVQLPGGALKGIVTDATATKTTEGVNVGSAPISGKRVGWRQLSQ
ncbi:MAG TPA: PilC/PilY family type IV pilus protein [Burkholderiales bacterium]|nr:PilC/PilY family type IV pilus protein [Burkholderiales bacterium]